MPSNLLAHHLRVLEQAGLITRRRSDGDRRRTYLRLAPADLYDAHAGPPARTAPRVLFVCTANSARSHLAAALWRRASSIPAASAGTRPAASIDPGAIDAAQRHLLPLPRLRPRHISDVRHDDDLIVTVCDLAREELAALAAVHWSVPDPVPGDADSYDAALDELSGHVGRLAPRLTAPQALAVARQAFTRTKRRRSSPASAPARRTEPAGHRVSRSRPPGRPAPSRSTRPGRRRT
jgi:protein-tyrosine-phosphatase